LLPSTQHVQVVLGGQIVADTHASYRVLETSHPPTYYLPVEDFAAGALRASDGTSFCEWKGVAAYFDLVAGGRTERRVAWGYPDPTPEYLALLDHVVTAQPGDFYGGWVTSHVVGPFKGAPGTMGW
jgi:uncharacterized protein (DUF427 family)